MKNKIGGCVIFFNPAKDVVSNIKSYYADLTPLIIIDNSPQENIYIKYQIVQLGVEMIYIWLGKNEGVAKALNIACKRALEHNCEWLLTMDQDSSFQNGDLTKMIAHLEMIATLQNNIGIMSPYHHVEGQTVQEFSQPFYEIKGTMTSGNLLNLRAWSQAGLFEEKLFIDYVDYEYCLRLRKNNFKIIQDNDVWLKHSLGNFQMKNFLGQKIGTSNHNHIRRYYKARNRFYTLRKYFGFDTVFGLNEIKHIFYDVLRILFFEKNRMLKIKATAVGLYHSMINHYGPYEKIKPKSK